MNKTLLHSTIDWSGIQSQIHMFVRMLASISTTIPRSSSQKCSSAISSLLFSWSVCQDAPTSLVMIWIKARVVHVTWMLHMVMWSWDLESLDWINISSRVASISEQCAVSLWSCARRWYLNACLPSASSQLHMLMFRATVHPPQLKNLDVDQAQDSNQIRCTTMFRSPWFKNKGHPDTWSHGNLAVLTANGRARITWVCSHIGFAPISCRNYASASAMKGVLQSIIIVFNGTLIWRYLDLCMLVFLGQSSSTQWVTTTCHVFSKLNLEIVLRFVVWHIVIWLKMSGWTW